MKLHQSKSQQTLWHRILGHLFKLLLTSKQVTVEVELPLMEASPKGDVLLLRRRTTMKAILYETYGPPDVLQLKDVPKPTPQANELLVRVRATTVTAADYRLRAMNVPPGFQIPARLVMGLLKPRKKILGTELAGDVEAVGNAVTKFSVGMRWWSARG